MQFLSDFPFCFQAYFLEVTEDEKAPELGNMKLAHSWESLGKTPMSGHAAFFYNLGTGPVYAGGHTGGSNPIPTSKVFRWNSFTEEFNTVSVTSLDTRYFNGGILPLKMIPEALDHL